MQLEIFG